MQVQGEDANSTQEGNSQTGELNQSANQKISWAYTNCGTVVQ